MSTSIHVFHTKSVQRRMLIISSNAYRDREEEIIQQKALEGYVNDSWQGDAFVGDNDLLYWHRGDPIGKIVYADMEGAFLIEIAEELPDAEIDLNAPYTEEDAPLEPYPTTIKAVWDAIESTEDSIEWGASIGFLAREDEQQQPDVQFTVMRKKETSVLPRRDAANIYTLSQVIGV